MYELITKIIVSKWYNKVLTELRLIKKNMLMIFTAAILTEHRNQTNEQWGKSEKKNGNWPLWREWHSPLAKAVLLFYLSSKHSLPVYQFQLIVRGKLVCKIKPLIWSSVLHITFLTPLLFNILFASVIPLFFLLFISTKLIV